MKLYQVPRGKHIRVAACGEHLYLDHLDGAYSYCLDVAGQVVHLSADTEVVIVAASVAAAP